MAFDAGQPARLGPAAVTVHDDGNVPRNRFHAGGHELKDERFTACGTDADDRWLRASKLGNSFHVIFCG
ncbi:MAG: hypothetical protein QOI96_1400, partial [Verrucomicrobiota bacterium]